MTLEEIALENEKAIDARETEKERLKNSRWCYQPENGAIAEALARKESIASAYRKKDKRQFKFNLATLAKLQQAMATDMTIQEACTFAGVKKQTYYNWLKTIPNFAERMDEARSVSGIRAKTTIARNLDDVDTAKWYLENRQRDLYSKKEVVATDNSADILSSLIEKIQNANGRLGDVEEAKLLSDSVEAVDSVESDDADVNAVLEEAGDFELGDVVRGGEIIDNEGRNEK